MWVGSREPHLPMASKELCAGTSTTPNGGARSSRATTGSTTRRTTDRLRRPLLEAGAKTDPVPPQIARQPLPQLEATLAGGAVVPSRRDLGQAHPKRVC